VMAMGRDGADGTDASGEPVMWSPL
jgi:hypothetical protein